MIAGIVGYLRKGEFPADIYHHHSIASLISKGKDEFDFLYNILIARANAFSFFQTQPGFVGSKWLKGDGTKSYLVTYYIDKDAFDRCNQSYKLESSYSAYKYQKEEFLKKFKLEWVEYGLAEVAADNLTFDQVETIVSQGMFTDWPAELSHSVK